MNIVKQDNVIREIKSLVLRQEKGEGVKLFL